MWELAVPRARRTIRALIGDQGSPGGWWYSARQANSVLLAKTRTIELCGHVGFSCILYLEEMGTLRWKVVKFHYVYAWTGKKLGWYRSSLLLHLIIGDWTWWLRARLMDRVLIKCHVKWFEFQLIMLVFYDGWSHCAGYALMSQGNKRRLS